MFLLEIIETIFLKNLFPSLCIVALVVNNLRRSWLTIEWHTYAHALVIQ